MKKLTVATIAVSEILLMGCASTSTGASLAGSDIQSKVEQKVQEKSASNLLDSFGLPSFQKEKTTEEKLADIATGESSLEDVATDMVADKIADQAIKSVL